MQFNCLVVIFGKVKIQMRQQRKIGGTQILIVNPRSNKEPLLSDVGNHPS